MRRLCAAAALLLADPALAQDQEARSPAAPPAQAGSAGAAAIYDMVAGDRETAWRINRMTGEMVICRVDTTGSLDSARARCSPVVFETQPQQSRLPSTGGQP